MMTVTERIIDRINKVKAEGFGEVVVRIQDGKVTYMEQKIGERVIDK